MATTTRQTIRPLNKCGSCGKTWYPRGSNLSSKCPRCGSSKTKVAGLGILGTIGCFALVAMFGGHPNKSADAPSAPVVASSASNTALTVDTPPQPPTEVREGGGTAAEQLDSTGASQMSTNEVAIPEPPTSSASVAASDTSAGGVASNSQASEAEVTPDVSASEGNEVFKHH